MNEDLRKQQPTDEVDLGHLFNAIGRLFDKLFKFIGSIFKAVFTFIVYIIKVFISYFKLILSVMILAFILGLGLEKVKPTRYASQMLVKPYFDSKYQLVNNVNYFNALISIQNYEELSVIFEISKESAKELKSFEINPGPESENDKIKEYDKFVKSIDSVRAQDITYDEFIENRNIYSGDFFEISVESTKKDIFKSLETGLNSSFKNTYSERKRQKRDTVIEMQKANIMASIASVDSLQDVYISVLKAESSKSNNKISLGEGFSLEPDRSQTREYDLLNREIELRQRLSQLEEKKVEEDTFFDTVSGFQDVGHRTSSLRDKYSIIFPVLSLLILSIVYFIVSTIKFVRNYER